MVDRSKELDDPAARRTTVQSRNGRSATLWQISRGWTQTTTHRSDRGGRHRGRRRYRDGGLAVRQGFPGDSQRIDSAIRDFYGTLSAKGPGVAVTKACAADRAEYDALPAAQQAAAEQGRMDIRIVSIDQVTVTGDRATAKMVGALTVPGSDDKTTTATEHLRKEEGTWRVCSTDGR